MKPTFTIPHSRVLEFVKQPIAQGLRYGQAFYNYMELSKMTSAENQPFLDRLHAADGEEAGKLIASITDYEN